MDYSNYLLRTKALLFSNTAKDALIVMGGSGISSVLGFLFVFIVARRLGPTNFGIYATIIGYASFLASIADFGVSQSLVRFVNESDSEKERKKWVGTSLLFVLTATLILGSLAALVYRFLLKNLWAHELGYTIPVFLIILTIAIHIFFLNLFQAIRKFWKRSFLDVSFSILRVAVVLVVLFLGTITVNWTLTSVILAHGFSIFLGLVFSRRYLLPILIEKKRITKVLSFSSWLAGANVFNNLYGRMDVLLLAWLSTAYVTGIYSASARFITIFPLVVSSLSSVIAPRFASFRSTKNLYSYFKKTMLISCLLSVFMIMLTFIARPLIILAYSDQYLESIPIFRLLVFTNIPFVLSIAPGNAIVYFFKRPQIMTAITLVQVIGLFALNLLLIPAKAAFGPVYSLLVMNTLGMVMLYSVYQYLFRKQAI
jgi:O-antigen/teichoic acid export membrane protein